MISTEACKGDDKPLAGVIQVGAQGHPSTLAVVLGAVVVVQVTPGGMAVAASEQEWLPAIIRRALIGDVNTQPRLWMEERSHQGVGGDGRRWSPQPTATK